MGGRVVGSVGFRKMDELRRGGMPAGMVPVVSSQHLVSAVPALVIIMQQLGAWGVVAKGRRSGHSLVASRAL